MLNKIIYKYLAIGFIFYAVTVFYAQSFLGNLFIVYGFSDKYYCFQFAVYFLLGCSLIDRNYDYMIYSRFGNRNRLVLNHFATYAIMAFVQISMIFFFGIFYYLLFERYEVEVIYSEIISNYGLFLLGTILLALITLIFKYSGRKVLHLHSQIFSYGVLVLDLLLVVPRLRQGLGFKMKFLFSWIIYDKSYLNFIMLIGFNIICIVILFYLARREDWF